MLTVQYPEKQIQSIDDLRAIPIHGKNISQPTRLDAVSSIHQITSPTEVDHYALRRVIDVYVQPVGEDLGRIATAIDRLTAQTRLPTGVTVTVARPGAGHAAEFPQFWNRPPAFGCLALPDSGRAVSFLPGSGPDSHRRAAGPHRRLIDSVRDATHLT